MCQKILPQSFRTGFSQTEGSASQAQGDGRPCLDRFQRSAACLFGRISKFGYVSSHMLNVLHWLPLQQRISFRIIAKQSRSPCWASIWLFFETSVHYLEYFGLSLSTLYRTGCSYSLFFPQNNQAEQRLLNGWHLALEWAIFATVLVPQGPLFLCSPTNGPFNRTGIMSAPEQSP